MGKGKDRIQESFISHTLAMRSSVAWARLPDHARRVLDRLELEHMRHRGGLNGRLPCTHDDFEAVGVPHKAVARAIRQCVTLGFVAITQQGTPSRSIYRNPTLYRLTYVYGRAKLRNGEAGPERSDDWRAIKTDADADAALAKADAMKSVDHVKRARAAIRGEG
mgnify:CR=1 FL=1